MHKAICPVCKCEDAKTIWLAPAFRICDRCHGEAQAIPVSCGTIPDEADDHTENVCTQCGGLNRESIGGFEWNHPVRCSVCKLVQPGFRVNRCLKSVLQEAKRIKSILLFHDGNFAAIDDKGNQIAELQQRTACELIGEYARLQGWDVDHCEFGVNGDICGKLRVARQGIKQVRYFDDFKG